MDLSRHTWKAAIELAVIISLVSGLAAIVLSATGDVPQVAIVLPVIVVAFTASWIRTDRVRREHAPVRLDATHRH